MGTVLREQYGEALADSAKAAAHSPGDFWITSQLAAIHAELGHLDDAFELQKQALAAENENAKLEHDAESDDFRLGDFHNCQPGSEGRLKEGRKRLEVYRARKPIKPIKI